MQTQKGTIGIIVSFIIVIGIVSLVIYGLVHTKTDDQVSVLPSDSSQLGAMSERKINQSLLNNKNKSMEQTAKNGDILVMNYTGRLVDGTVFDSNVDPKFHHVQPFEFTLGAGQVIKGWDEGLLGMKVGEKKTLTIPPEKGYGSRAVSSIPANSTLIFDVELIAIK